MNTNRTHQLAAIFQPSKGIYVTLDGLTVLLPAHWSVLSIQRHLKELVEVCS